MIKVDNDSFPGIKYSHDEDIQHFIQDLMTKDGEHLLTQLVFTPLRDCSYELAVFKFDIMVEI